jgi:hypothetical protein
VQREEGEAGARSVQQSIAAGAPAWAKALLATQESGEVITPVRPTVGQGRQESQRPRTGVSHGDSCIG